VAWEHDIKLGVAKLPEAKRGIVLLLRRWGGERSFGRISRFRRLARDYERSPEILAGLCHLAFIVLMLKKVAEALA
jgi:transposase